MVRAGEKFRLVKKMRILVGIQHDQPSSDGEIVDILPGLTFTCIYDIVADAPNFSAQPDDYEGFIAKYLSDKPYGFSNPDTLPRYSLSIPESEIGKSIERI